jgi:prepilin-type N-terminal cleavage/methylation domain-containing protein
MCATGAKQYGFTLAEVAVVVLIVGLLVGGLLGTYSTQVELGRISDTRKTLETARDALIGFAAANGRLPCPATATSSAEQQQPSGSGTCTVSVSAGGGQPGVGFFPAATLALTPTDSQGFLIDSWGSRIRYAVTNNKYAGCAGPPATAAGTTPEFTTPPTTSTTGTLRIGLTDVCSNTPGPDLQVCTTAAAPTPLSNVGAPTAACYGTSTTLTTSAVAVIFSVGKNGVPGGTGGAAGSDESFNLDNDRVFISHNPTPASASGGEFDDIVIWLSPSILYNRLLSGGL